MNTTSSLSGFTVAISASGSSDLDRLGLLEGHLRTALGEIARAVVTLGGALQYCGHMKKDGYTVFLIDEVKRYSRYDVSLSVILAWNVHRRIPHGTLREIEFDLGLIGDIEYLDIKGESRGITDWPEEPEFETKPEDAAAALTAMRVYAASKAHARVLIGGKRFGYSGSMPGVLEEAIIALREGVPIFLSGGYGGVASDIIRVVQPSAMEWLPPGSSVGDDGHADALAQLASLVNGAGWKALANGLSEEENRQLATTHRASEVAMLVSLGLGRLRSAQGGS